MEFFLMGLEAEQLKQQLSSLGSPTNLSETWIKYCEHFEHQFLRNEQVVFLASKQN
jgi:hypothetical protein